MENSILRAVFIGQLPKFSKHSYQGGLSEIDPPRPGERQKRLTPTFTRQFLTARVFENPCKGTLAEYQERWSDETQNPHCAKEKASGRMIAREDKVGYTQEDHHGRPRLASSVRDVSGHRRSAFRYRDPLPRRWPCQ